MSWLVEKQARIWIGLLVLATGCGSSKPRTGSGGGGGAGTGGMGGRGTAGTAGGTGGARGTGGSAGTGGSEGDSGVPDPDGGANPPTPLDMNDVTILAPLPQSMATPVLLRGADPADDGTA